MPDKVVGYTRTVTIAWCVFFAAQLAISASLLASSPEATWSFFVNILNLPIVDGDDPGGVYLPLVVFRQRTRTGLVATLVRSAPCARLPWHRTMTMPSETFPILRDGEWPRRPAGKRLVSRSYVPVKSQR